jgi:hypothetical protein
MESLVTTLRIFCRIAAACLGLFIVALLVVASAYPELDDRPQPLWTLTLFAYAVVLILPPSLWKRARVTLISAVILRSLGLLWLLWAVGSNAMGITHAGDLMPLVLFTWLLPILAAASVLEVWWTDGLRASNAAQPSVAADAPQAARR